MAILAMSPTGILPVVLCSKSAGLDGRSMKKTIFVLAALSVLVMGQTKLQEDPPLRSAPKSGEIRGIITPAAEIAEMSERSHPASDASFVRKSIDRSGLPNVLIGFIAPRTTTGWPLVMPPSNPPALLVCRT